MNSKNIFKLLKFADTFTLLNALSGTLVIYFSITHVFTLAASFMLLSVFFDYLDGKVARKTKTSVFGKELDSLADIISFGAAPVVFGFSQIQTKLAVVCFGVFLICGILRLARYNVTNIEGFIGMPITINGVIVPLIYFANLPPAYYPYIFLVSGILMISPIKVKNII